MIRGKSLLLSLIFLIFSTFSYAQKLKKSERAIINDLKTTITYLASDELQGRRTGTQGEVTASKYLAEQFKLAGLDPKGDDESFIQTFTIDEGREILPATFLTISDKKIDSAQFFPLTFSSDGSVDAMVSPSIHESNSPWFYDIKDLINDNENNPHFDLADGILKAITEFKTKGATGIIVYNSGKQEADLKFDGKSKENRIGIPVIFIDKEVSDKFQKENFIDISFKVVTGEKTRQGHNVIGYMDNGAANTIVIGAHFDHLGYGEDHNSLWTGKPEIHNGADDNASGTALVLELAKLLKKSKYKNNNYLFACFSGEELGLFGSKYLTDHMPIPINTVNYMINCDMVGRLNENHTITIGGYGTSPQWSQLPQKTKTLNVKFDSSGIGPSDHTSFYLKNIPVLFFFTGTHPDYHKPTDDVEKINFIGELRVIQYIEGVIKETNKLDKLSFTKTKEPDMGTSPRFTVTLGIMPDYTYSGKGLRVDGIISGKVADHAGMLAGDVITAIGEYKVTDINNYMKALSRFKKGDSTTVQFLREAETKTVSIVF